MSYYSTQLLTVKVRRPTLLLSRPWETKLELLGRNPRGLYGENVYIQKHAGVVMLTPIVRPADYPWKSSDYTLQASSSNVTFFDGQNADAAGGYFIGVNSLTSTDAWAAWLSSTHTIAADQGLEIRLVWVPPDNSTYLVPSIEIFPRIDFGRSTTINGYTYYFAPLIFVISAQNVFTVYEYEYDDYSQFETNPSSMLKRTYQHQIIPVGKGQYIDTYFRILPIENDGFVVESPALEGGGFAYYSRIQRENLKLFPEGQCGIRSYIGGLAIFSFVPIQFPSSGYVVGPPMAKQRNDDKAVTATADAWTPTNTSYTVEVVDPETREAIPAGSVFQNYTYKVTLNSSDGIRSPVINYVKCDVEGERTEEAETEVDISDDVNIEEQVSTELAGHKARIRLKNPNGQYTELALRPLNEIDVDIKGVDRAIFYTLNPKMQLWQSPQKEVLWIDWECGDMWVRLEHYMLTDEDVYDGMTLKDAVSTFLQRLGLPPDKIDIDDVADNLILPRARGAKDPIFKPQTGTTAAQFLRELHRKFCSSWIMRFRGDGTFELKPSDYVSTSRTYYLSHELAQQQYEQAVEDGLEPDSEDYEYTVNNLEIELLHDQFYNEIWVIGEDSATGRPLVYCYIDTRSQTDKNYEYFVGERRVMIVETRSNNTDVLQWICNELKKWYCRLRRRISFITKYDPTLWPGDFIKIYGYAPIFRVESIDTRIEPGTVITTGGSPKDIAQCRITAVEWPLDQ